MTDGMRRLRALLVAAAAGAAFAHLFDPERGRRRRRYLRERTAGSLRHAWRRFARGGRATALQALGHTKGALHSLRPGPAASLDDVGLAHKVETVLFRDPHVPKGQISINAESGTVFVRGQLESAELIDYVANAARKIAGVGEVVNLLHQAGTEAPHPPPKVEHET